MRFFNFLNPSKTRLSRRHFLSAAGALFPMALLGGGLSCTETSANTIDRGRILENIVKFVIIPNYEAASMATQSLLGAAQALRSQPNATTFAQTRDAYLKARDAWKPSDAFVLGPSDDLGLTGGAIDSTLNGLKLDALAADGPEPTAAWLSTQGADVRGFPALEWLLFDPAKGEAELLAKFGDPDLGPRRCAFTASLAEDLHLHVDAVKKAWLPTGSNFGAELSLAGRGSSTYARLKNGVDAVINALIAAAEILTALRLAKPMGLDLSPQSVQPDLVESGRSDHSNSDLLSVITGIRSIYLGPPQAPKGTLFFSDAVREANAGADQRMREALLGAEISLKAIPSPLRTALGDHFDAVSAAHAAVRYLKLTLQTDISNALGTSVGFNVTDGD